MLRTLVEQHHCKFIDRVADWQEAIRQSCALLEADGCVDGSYAELIIDCVQRYGPYIVIIPNVCLAHSQEHAGGVQKTGLSFLHLAEPVDFSLTEGESHPAQLIFALSAVSPEQHLQHVVALSDLLGIHGMPDLLAAASCEEDLLRLQERYLDHPELL